MAISKGFLHVHFKTLGIPKSRIILGILIGLSFAFILYSWFYIIREVLRVLSANFGNDLLVLTDKEVQFYNLFFAFISVIIGQSVCFGFWNKRSWASFSLLRYKRHSILNDQANLITVFLNWAIKLAFIFGLFFGWVFNGGFYTFRLMPEYFYLFMLIVIVLFLNTWGSVRKVFKGKSLKWMLVTFVLHSLISWGMSMINLVDYKKINEGFLKKNKFEKYNLQLPETDFCEKLIHKFWIEDLYLVKSPSNSQSLIFYSDETEPLQNIRGKIIATQNEYEDFVKYRIMYRLYIDKNINMCSVDSLKNNLFCAGVSRIVYAVVPATREYDVKYYKDFGINLKLTPGLNMKIANNQNHYKYDVAGNAILLKIEKDGSVLLNNKLTKFLDIDRILKKALLDNRDYIVKIYYNGNTSFNDYLKLWIIVKQTIVQIRNDFAMRKYKMGFKELREQDQEHIIELFPLRIREGVIFDSSERN